MLCRLHRRAECFLDDSAPSAHQPPQLNLGEKNDDPPLFLSRPGSCSQAHIRHYYKACAGLKATLFDLGQIFCKIFQDVNKIDRLAGEVYSKNRPENVQIIRARVKVRCYSFTSLFFACSYKKGCSCEDESEECLYPQNFHFQPDKAQGNENHSYGKNFGGT